MNSENEIPPDIGRSLQESLTDTQFLELTHPQRALIHGPTLFSLKYRRLPCVINEMYSANRRSNSFSAFNIMDEYIPLGRDRQSGDKRTKAGMLHATSAIQFLINEYKVDPNEFLYETRYDAYDGDSLISNLYVDLGNYLSMKFYVGYFSPSKVDNPNNLKPDIDDKIFYCFEGIQVYHIPQSVERARTLLQQLSKFKLYPVDKITEATLEMVCHTSQNSFYTSFIKMKKPHIVDLKLHYGDEFPEIHEELLEILQEKDSTGITFLHGPPGTGKTYYLRYLINEIKDKSLIYVPPDLVPEITKPGFLPFLIQNPNSILIIEDAENIIRDRQQDNFLPNQAVSNLLNLSDGLLGDATHQQIICTFNCDVKGIDPALLREGRLVIEHKFDKLNPSNARRLCVELGVPGNGEDIHEPITLAEIYARKNTSAAKDISTEGDENGVTVVTKKRKLCKKQKQLDNISGMYS